MSTIHLGTLRYSGLSANFEMLTGVDGSDLRSKVNTLMAQVLWDKVEEQLRIQLAKALTDYLNDQLQVSTWQLIIRQF